MARQGLQSSGRPAASLFVYNGAIPFPWHRRPRPHSAACRIAKSSMSMRPQYISSFLTSDNIISHNPTPCTAVLHVHAAAHDALISVLVISLQATAPLLHQLASSALCQATRRLASTSCNALESLISTHMLSNTLHSAQHLQGNFAPIAEECAPLSCSCDGPLPTFLDGMYVRNGPNEQFKSNALTHPFDGDGMLHCVNFHGGDAVTYCCRYVHTSRFVQERAAGQALFPKIFSSLTAKRSFVATAYISLAMLRHLLGLVDLTKGMGLANTGVVFHHGKLLALGEDDLPYSFRIQSNGDIVNTGRYKFTGHGGLPKAMTSHPKTDPETGEMVFFSYNIFFPPYLTFFTLSPGGTLSKQVPIHLQVPCMVHDFAITPHFIIFPETQVVFHPLHMLHGRSPIECDLGKVQRFGVLSRRATDDSKMQWFDVPRCNCFHILNAWEESNPNIDIMADSSALSHNVEEIILIMPNLSSANDIICGKFDKSENTLTEVRLNLDKGTATQSSVLGQCLERGISQTIKLNVEMGTMNEHYRGVKNKYVYMGVLGRSLHSLSGLVKFDLETRTVVSHKMFDSNGYASEPIFVPAKLHPKAPANFEPSQEDKGCLLCFLHRENGGAADTDGFDQNACRMLVLDAQSPTLDTIASITIPRRIPYGFHGLYIPRNTL